MGCAIGTGCALTAGGAGGGAGGAGVPAHDEVRGRTKSQRTRATARWYTFDASTHETKDADSGARLREFTAIGGSVGAALGLVL